MTTELHSHEELERLVLELGFLPFFKNDIVDFSIEEFTPSDMWFSDDCDGPWEWKGPVACSGSCAYGKLFDGKAGFVSLKWYPEFANYRRKTYLDRIDEAGTKDKLIYDTLVAHESLLSREIKALCGFRKKVSRPLPSSPLLREAERAVRKKERASSEGYDTVMTRLQMSARIITIDFEYLLDKRDRPYGWGIARYTTPELMFGAELMESCASHTAEQSKEILLEHLATVVPQASEAQLLHLLK